MERKTSLDFQPKNKGKTLTSHFCGSDFSGEILMPDDNGVMPSSSERKHSLRAQHLLT